MRKFIVALTTMTMLLSSIPAAVFAETGAAEKISITLDSKTALVDGKEVPLEAAAKQVNGQTVAPVRFLFDQLGIGVRWDPSGSIILGDDESVTLKIGSGTAVVNGQEVPMGAPVVIEKNRALAPVRYILEHFGAEVTWSAEKKEMTIHYSESDKLANSFYRNTTVAGEEAVIAALDARYGWNAALELGKIGSSTKGWGYHLAGTPKGEEASKYVYDEFEKIGLKPEYDKFPVVGMDFRDASLTLTSCGNTDIPVLPLSGTVPTKEGGLTGDLVFVNHATKQDLEGVDLTGKIAVAAGNLDYFPWYNEIGYQCQLHGAAALIYYCENYYGQDESGEAFYQASLSGSANPAIPVLTTPIKYGKQLEEMLKTGNVTGKLISNVQNYPDAEGLNVIASIKGAKYPDEYVIMSAHKDAHFYGFQDDSLGIGMLLALAKAMVDTDYKPDRTILFVALDAEETGALDTYYSWLIGSWNYIREKAGKLGGKVVGNVNIELVAATEADYLMARSSDTLFPFLQDLSKGLTQTAHTTPGIQVFNGMENWDDSFCFSYFGIPGATTNYLYEEVNANYYHSQFETEERADFGKYEDCVKLYSTMVMRMDKLPINPYNLSVTPGHYLEAFDPAALEALTPGSALPETTEKFRQDAADLWDKQILISSLYQQGISEGKDLKAADELIVEYNNALRESAATVITGTQYLDQGTTSFLTPYYVNTIDAYDSGIASLKAGDGAAMLETFSNMMYAAYYSEFMEKETFNEVYKEPLNVDTWDADLYWATGRLIKYYDFYDTLAATRAKVSKGETDFAPEIAALESMRADAYSRLKDAVDTDLSMWKKADAGLPLDTADKILDLLQ